MAIRQLWIVEAIPARTSASGPHPALIAVPNAAALVSGVEIEDACELGFTLIRTAAQLDKVKVRELMEAASDSIVAAVKPDPDPAQLAIGMPADPSAYRAPPEDGSQLAPVSLAGTTPATPAIDVITGPVISVDPKPAA